MYEYTFFPTNEKEKYFSMVYVDSTINIIRKIIDNIDKPFIFDTNSYNSFFQVYYKDEYVLSSAVKEILSKLSGKQGPWEQAEVLCDQDEEWNNWRNKDLTYVAYYRFKLKPEYVEKMLPILTGWIVELEELKIKMKEDKNREEIERKNRYESCSIVNVYAEIRPENGHDGYYDVDVKVIDGEIIRAVARDVFDFGTYEYPKRVEGSKEVFERNKWTEDELTACKWLGEFSPFGQGVRM